MSESSTPPSPANSPPPLRKGTWLCAQVELANGSIVEIRLPNCINGAVSSYVPTAGETPCLVVETPDGARKRGRLTQFLGEKPE